MIESKINLSEQQLKRVRSLYYKFQEGDEKLTNMKAETGIMVVGKSNIGKTTLCHLIANSKLKVVDNIGLAAIDLQDPNSTTAKIGMQGTSTTNIPNHFSVKYQNVNFNIYDCPGLCDSNQFESLISNSYYVYSTFLNIPENMFALVIPQDKLTGGTARDFVESVKLFLNYFEIEDPTAPPPPAADQNPSKPVKKKIKLQQIAKRTLLVLTKTRRPPEVLMGLIDKFVITNQKNNIGEFMKFYQSMDKIDVIKEAEQGQPLPEQNVLKKMCKMPYLDRRLKDGGVDMDIIKYQLAEKQLKPTEIELAGKAFLKGVQDLLELISCVLDALLEIKTNYTTESYQYLFIDKWKAAYQQIASNPTKKNTKLVKPPAYPHFSILKLFKKVYGTIEPLDYGNITDEKIQDSVISIITAISQLLPLDNAKFEVIQSFIYLVNRKYEEIKILLHIKPDYDSRKKAGLDKLRSFLEEPYGDVQKRFAISYQVQPNMDVVYYDQATEILSKYKDGNKQLLKKIGTCQMQKATLKLKQQKVIQAIKGFVQARETDQLYNTQANAANYIQVDTALNRKIADLLFSIQFFSYAVLFYKVINDSKMILDCYKQQIKLKPTEVYKIRMEMGDYLVTILRNDGAILEYKYAADSTTDVNLKSAALQKMSDTVTNQNANLATFQNRLTAKEFYYKLPADFDKNKMFAELQAAEPTIKVVSQLFSSDLIVK